MTTPDVDWKGSFAAIVTPFTRDGDLDEALLRENVEMTVREGSHGIVVGGHNGEAHLSTDAERRRTWQIGVEVVAGRIPVLAGSGAIRTEHAVELTEAARATGVDGVMVELPYFMLPNATEIVEHYRTIAAAVDVPIMVYNHPKRMGVSLTPALAASLADVDNVVAVKDSSGDFALVASCMEAIGGRLRFFVGSTRLYGLAAIASGADGFVDGLPQVLGGRVNELYSAAARGDYRVARALQSTCHAVGRLLYERGGTWPATGKDAMRALGRPGGWPRRPLLPMDDDDVELLRTELARLGLVSGQEVLS